MRRTRLARLFPGTLLSLVVGAGACDDGASKTEVSAADATPAKLGAEPKSTPAGIGTAEPSQVVDAVKPPADSPARSDAPADGPKAQVALPSVDELPPPAAEDADPTPPEGAADEGPAYFAVRERGLVRLAAGKFSIVENSPKLLFRDLHIESDGKLYLLGSDGIMRIDGATAVMVAETSYETTGSVDAFAKGPDATLWAVGYKGISSHDGDVWHTEDKSVLGDSVTLLKGVVVDASGRVWIASSNKIHTRQDGKWVDVDVSKVSPTTPFFDQLSRGPGGETYALASSQLIRLTDPKHVKEVDLKIKGFASLGYLAFGANGHMALRSGVDQVMLVDAGATWKAGTDFAANQIHGVGVDGRGRVWVTSDIGISILGPGDAITEWNSGSVLELAGKVEQIVPMGQGPALPHVGEAKTSGLKGVILADGKGLGEAELELCPSPNMMFETSPCDKSPIKFAGKTDGAGAFEFGDVPIGAYGIAVKVGGKWQLTVSSNFGAKMKEGLVYDLGAIKLKTK